MPRLSVWLIRSAFLHLLFGFTIGATILWEKGPGGIPGAWRWLPVHIHVVLLGWIVQLTMGVAYWILPRFVEQGAAQMTQRRGRELLAWASFVLLNASTVAGLTSLFPWPWGLASAAVLAALAGLAFVLHAWPRVKPFLQ